MAGKKNVILILLINTCFLFGLAHERRSKYFIALKKNEDSFLGSLNKFTSFLPPVNMLYADPMIFKHNNINYLFFEEFDYKKGTIAYVTVDEDMNISKPIRVLELDCHLSFPHVFKDGENIYMTPETISLNEVALYEAVDFPQKWQKKRILVSGYNFSDPILFKKNDYYWLFVSINVSQLCIFYAKDLDDEFKPHPVNFEKRDGRNAGNVFYLDHKFIRPVMDCRKIYGYSMILKEIVKLDTNEFIEKDIYKIDPDWAPGLNGTHTFNLNEDVVVYDGRRSILLSEDHIYSSLS